ncbi:uncharacterized protein E6C27_scaffold40G00520 [Cucumis melo var. makuwa]|uniref:Retrotransposon gag domain-containing protein n=1 Tax=Cucumis melo var. makuwa TaxID=1194695 RepID=A0A5A7VQA5_CUCMM|nr:uncharacterized protein E6C27_scaffold40G00520 [Cucumis melo var. makuwa]
MMRGKIEKTMDMGEDSKLIMAKGERRGEPIDYKMKIDLPSYDGKRNIEIFLDWVKNTENFFYEYTQKKEGSLSSTKAKSWSSAWWEQVEVNRKRNRKRTIIAWEKMKKLMKARFLPPNYEQTLYNQYQSCRQGGWAMAGYIEEFQHLGACTNLMDNEQHLNVRFIVEELIETNSKKTTRRSPWDSLNSRRSVAANGDTPHPQSEKDQEKEKTFDLNGTKAETASKKQVENPHQWPNLSKCFRCGKQGTSPILVLNKEL